MRNIIILLFVTVFLTSSANAKDNEQIKKNKEESNNTLQVDYSKISNFYGKWNIKDVHKYKGGLTTEEEAKGYIGQTITIAGKEFLFILEGKVEAPKYKYKKVNNKLPEGEVPTEKTTAFYGYKDDRDIVHLYELYDKDELFVNIEVMSKDEILIPFDGWILILSRVK